MHEIERLTNLLTSLLPSLLSGIRVKSACPAEIMNCTPTNLLWTFTTHGSPFPPPPLQPSWLRYLIMAEISACPPLLPSWQRYLPAPPNLCCHHGRDICLPSLYCHHGRDICLPPPPTLPLSFLSALHEVIRRILIDIWCHSPHFRW